jgi:hypothetical protein
VRAISRIRQEPAHRIAGTMKEAKINDAEPQKPGVEFQFGGARHHHGK